MLRKIIKLLIGITVFSALLWSLGMSADQIKWPHARESAPLLALMALLATVQVLGQYAAWLYAVRCSGYQVGLKDGYYFFTMSNLSKYVPMGKVLQFVSFSQFVPNPSLAVNCISGLVLTIITGMIAGGFLGVLTFNSLAQGIPTELLISGAILVIIGGWFSTQTEFVMRFLAKRFDKAKEINLKNISFKAFLLLILMQIIFSWMPELLIANLLYSLINPSAQFMEKFDLITASYVLAAFSGYLVVISPSGIGVREGVWAYLMKDGMGAAFSSFIVLGLRFFQVLGDFIFSLPMLATFAINLLHRKQIKS